MKCSNGKIGYDTCDLALEALIDHRARFNHKENSGPINVYECTICGLWHFTSKGIINPILNDKETKKRIERLSHAYYWENRSF